MLCNSYFTVDSFVANAFPPGAGGKFKDDIHNNSYNHSTIFPQIVIIKLEQQANIILRRTKLGNSRKLKQKKR